MKNTIFVLTVISNAIQLFPVLCLASFLRKLMLIEPVKDNEINDSFWETIIFFFTLGGSSDIASNKENYSYPGYL